MPRSADQRSRGVTIREVADEAGVSISTVSRALDERQPSHGAKAERVREVANALGYQRDVSASNLRRGSTGTVGVIVPRLTDTVMALLYEHIADACERRGLFATVATTHDDPDRQRRVAESLLRRVDGLVLASARYDDDYITDLQRRGVNHVLALRTSGTSRASVGDDHLGGYLAGRHLVDLGHRRLGVITGPRFASSVVERLRGFTEALAQCGIEEPQVEFGDSFTMEAGEDACSRLMTRRDVDRPTAIFAMNDNSAMGALSALSRLRLRVPDDVSIVGYNDIPVASRLPVPLTTLRTPFREIASSAVELLVNGPGPDGRRVLAAAPTLIPRQSSARPRPS